MKHSTALTKYLEQNPDAIEFPESHFGPNYETVFNYWSFLDTLTQEQKDSMRGKDRSTERYGHIVFAAFHTAIGRRRTANLSHFLGFNMFLAMISYEIIGMDILLEQGHSLYFIPLTENL
jgi:hypothetical protein